MSLYNLRNLLQKMVVCCVCVPAILMFFGCTYIEPENQRMHDKAHEFIAAIEKNEFATALTMLTKDARNKINHETFSSTPGDFRGIIDSFRQADISTRSSRPKNELSVYVAKLSGREGVLIFVMVEEDGEWKIANILENT